MIDVHQDEVLTGEAVALDVQPIGFFLRALGALIDVVLGADRASCCSRWCPRGSSAQSVLDDVALPILTVTMLVIVTGRRSRPSSRRLTRGRSLGKLAVGGRIVRADGGASGFRQAFIRALVGVFEI